MSTLDEIATKLGTDKSSASHDYCRTYAQYLEPLRHQPIRMLELGVGGHENPDLGGASLRMWREYFTQATVTGLDLEHKDFTIDGATIYQGSQADPDIIATIAAERGPFDFIIDDASHISSLTIRSFELLYPHLKPGGLYIIEDTHMAYHAHWYGPREARENPDSQLPDGKRTAMQFIRRLCDEVNYHGPSDLELYPRRYWLGYSLEYVHCYYNTAIIRKADRDYT
jgi:hypothetical protein